MASANRPVTRLATRLSFLVAGFGIACWAPLVPFAKQRLAIDDGTLGLLLLCLGVGSVVAMPLTGFLSARCGSKPIIILGGLGVAVLLPLGIELTGFDGAQHRLAHRGVAFDVVGVLAEPMEPRRRRELVEIPVADQRAGFRPRHRFAASNH
jgi:MFS-type transporter involved in bile tolerance (Atg22 family)